MDSELTKAVAPVVAALIAALIAIWTWYGQRAADRKKQQEEQSIKYVTPFLFAAEDLQSRLYNIVRLHPENLLGDREERQIFATETLYLIAQYFFYESLVLQYTPLGRDHRLIPLVQRIRKAFAGAHSKSSLDGWCIFHPRQRALGRAVAEEGSLADRPSVASLIAFNKAVTSGVLDPIGVVRAIESFDDRGRLSAESKMRLGQVQSRIVDLLEYLEPKLVAAQYSRIRLLKRRSVAKRFTLFAGAGGGGRERAA